MSTFCSVWCRLARHSVFPLGDCRWPAFPGFRLGSFPEDMASLGPTPSRRPAWSSPAGPRSLPLTGSRLEQRQRMSTV